jgi:hypothetical protein
MQGSFVICFHSARLDNLEQTLRFLTQDQREVVCQSEIVLTCQNTLSTSERQTLEELCSSFNKHQIFELNVNDMNLPKLTNFSVQQTKTNKIIVLESDRILPKKYFEKILTRLKPKIQISAILMTKFKAPYSDEEIRNKKFEGKQEYRSSENQIGMRNMWSGNTAFWREDFIEAEMMDENYVGYGWADSDMCNKMKSIGVQDHWLNVNEYHLWHPAATYGVSDQKELFINNGIRFCQKWNVPKPDWLIAEIAEHRKTKLFF